MTSIPALLNLCIVPINCQGSHTNTQSLKFLNIIISSSSISLIFTGFSELPNQRLYKSTSNFLRSLCRTVKEAASLSVLHRERKKLEVDLYKRWLGKSTSNFLRSLCRTVKEAASLTVLH